MLGEAANALDRQSAMPPRVYYRGTGAGLRRGIMQALPELVGYIISRVEPEDPDEHEVQND
jgi:hypothetical protein